MIHFVGFHDLQINAPIGVHEEERIIGNAFSIDLQVAVQLPDTDVLELNETIDYVRLMEITRRHFSVSTLLLENVGNRIVRDVMQEWHEVKGVKLTIRKLHPMISFTVQDTFIQINTGYFDRTT
jgi:dihydroneopterin aldolase